ncbi:matrix-remodeling-associated protein 7 isoform X3 [Xiphophorus couchianus]|uniref:matrix-remodeling-associated protein 7 isoform X3 n=1 Tax=Xiphophorus couchianus TaxID=32473 RepID=UPI001016C6E3|nr:matrix-remodeling-associated protein 7 isoform X3 [Xiphophorus couchianus]
MEATLALAAIIFTLLAMVVATSLLKGSSPAADFANARSYFGQKGDGGSATSEAKLNGHVAGQERKKDADNWSEISGSSHDHWDVVKSEQGHPHFHAEGGAAVESSSSTSSLSVPSLETEGATESPGDNTKVESDANNSLKYVPGKARSHHLEVMMSKEELAEEQRVQREQLAAIFQLLKDNKETFGDVSEGDLEEQLRLYSI